MSNILFALTVTVLCAGVVVHCDESVVLRAFEHFGNILQIYNEKLDKLVPWDKLKGAIDALDNSVEDYEGDTQNYMTRIRELKSKTFLTYAQASRTMFEWCISTNVSLDIYFRYENTQLSDKDLKVIRGHLLEILNRGEQKIKDSKNRLNTLEMGMVELRTLLGKMTYVLKDDFRPTGIYGRRRTNLEDELRKKQSGTGIALIFSVFVVLASAILGLVFGPIGLAIGLSVALASAGIPIAILKGHVIPSIEQRIQIIDTYFETLERAIHNANNALDEVEKSLKIELDNVEEMLGFLQAATDKNDSDLILLDFFRPREINPVLRDVQKKCRQYVIRHAVTKYQRHQRHVLGMDGDQKGNIFIMNNNNNNNLADNLNLLNKNYIQLYNFDMRKYI